MECLLANMRLLLLLFIVFWGFVASAQDSVFQKTDKCLKAYVRMGKVDYKRLLLQGDSFDSLISVYEEYDLTGKTDAFRRAFYLNAYNLLVIHGILQEYPVASPMEIPGFFKEQKFRIAKEELTLDEIEFGRLFAVYKDPRMHFALNCGATSCPTLYSEAFLPEKVEDQLAFCQTMVMDRDDYVFVDRKERVVKVSKIFEWYQDMFEEASGSLRNYINENRFVTVPRNYEIVFMEYDWSLNELKN